MTCASVSLRSQLVTRMSASLVSTRSVSLPEVVNSFFHSSARAANELRTTAAISKTGILVRIALPPAMDARDTQRLGRKFKDELSAYNPL
jgi:hypothetical protein